VEAHARRLLVEGHPGGVCRAEGVEHLAADVRDPAGRQRALLPQHRAERPRPDELHDDPGPAVLLDHVVDDDHARVGDPPGRPRLPYGPLVERLALLLARRAVEHLLDGHRTAEHLVMGPPDDPHAAAADGFEQVVPARDATPLVHQTPSENF
jgi:hypothetical protein